MYIFVYVVLYNPEFDSFKKVAVFSTLSAAEHFVTYNTDVKNYIIVKRPILDPVL
jgi:hypothetical protein